MVVAARSVSNHPSSTLVLHWVLRIAAAMCFIGHGAFGILMKPAWVSYFLSLGFSEGTAFRLMPIVGTVDILMAIFVLLSPCRAVLLWMTVWGAFTALLRPWAGEPFWETLERAGNYGVPLAFLAMSGWARTWREWFEPITPAPRDSFSQARLDRTALVLRLATGLLLIGHGGFGAFMHKSMLAEHYASVGLSVLPGGALAMVPLVGWTELLMGVAVLLAPVPVLLIAVLLWKVATELLYPLSGAPIWEFVERGGSYAAPLGLLLILRRSPRMASVPEVHGPVAKVAAPVTDEVRS
jgi:hypothetical protein